jgi:D-alanine-D-alanine ligase
MKKRVGVIYGSRSVEHEVSVITGLQAVENCDSSRYEVIPIYIDKSGNWYTGKELRNVSIYKDFDRYRKKCKQFFPSLNAKDKKNILNTLDAVILATHGTYGEDGKLQGLLDFIGVPYSSCNVVGSAAGMDKIIMKKVFIGMEQPVLPYLWFNRGDWQADRQECINKVHYTLDYPLFVKPANLGSSIGISMASTEEELATAIEVACGYDHRILVEKAIENAVEVNCSVLQKNGEILVSALEEPVRWEKFLSFEDKYIRGNAKSKGGMQSMSRKIPADIPGDIADKIRACSKEVYRAMDCKGVVRIDYILEDDKKKFFINEINTIPGSFSFYLWEPQGITFTQLLDIIIEEAIAVHKSDSTNILQYDSTILDKSGGAKS